MPDIQQQIAHVLQRHFFWWANHSSIGPNAHCQCGERPRYWSDWTDHVAGVLVSELGLTRETAETYFGDHQCVNVSRYATEWTPDV